MSKDVYSITCSALPDSARVAGFRGTEAISQTYEIHVYLLLGAEGSDLDLDDVVGAKAKLALDRDDGRPPFVFHGMFCAFELLHEIGARSLFHAVLVPQLWHLTQTFHSRMWTQKTIPEILAEVLEDGGLSSTDYELRFAADYKVHEHVCQYQESNFDFISRWMEREGMYYFFEHGDDAEKLVITDASGFHEALHKLPIPFVAAAGHDHSAREALHTFTCKTRALPASVKLRDYDYTKPTLDVSGSASLSKTGMGEINVYGNRFFTPDDGKRLAKLRAEELLARKTVYRGTGTHFHLRSGYTFTLEDHARPSFDQQYLAVAVEHVGNQQISTPELQELTGIDSDKVYRVEVTAIPHKVQFRAERTTAWPRVYGFENGTICGPADSDYAQIDDAGRYNVKFKFDESGLKGGKASTYVRMMQPHGGSPEGFHFPLRKGTEVVFTFLGGDPDRPVISGVVPDTTNPSPVTAANYTKNVIQTGGYNRLEIEDLAGQQRVTLSTPHAKTHLLMGNPKDGHELIARTEGNSLHHTDINHDQFVGANCAINVVSNQSETIGATKSQTVTGDVTHLHKANHTHTTNANHTHTTKANHTHTTDAVHHLKVGGDHKIETGGKRETKTDGEEKWAFNADLIGHIAGQWTNVTNGVTNWTFTAAKNETVAGMLNNKFLGLKMETVIGLSIDLLVGGKIEVASAPTIEIAPTSAEVKADKKEMEAVKTEIGALKTAVKGADEALTGLRKMTVGLHNMQAGARMAAHGMSQYENGLEMVNSGLSNEANGLKLLE
jgi:type VI secretion system secreted protein VgrG